MLHKIKINFRMGTKFAVSYDDLPKVNYHLILSQKSTGWAKLHLTFKPTRCSLP